MADVSEAEKEARRAEVDAILEREFDRRNRQARYDAAGFPREHDLQKAQSE